MFYEAEPGPELRFGDVVRGFVCSTPIVASPVLDGQPHEYQIDVSAVPTLFAVLTPCCNIGENCISLAPLERIPSSFFKNPFWAEDLTRVNTVMPPEKAVPPEKWEAKAEAEKAAELQKGAVYALLSYFVYACNPLLLEYEYSRKIPAKTGCYLIDFRKAFRVCCKKIQSAAMYPLEIKCLELTTVTRSQLRDKMSFYYGRTPAEDLD